MGLLNKDLRITKKKKKEVEAEAEEDLKQKRGKPQRHTDEKDR